MGKILMWMGVGTVLALTLLWTNIVSVLLWLSGSSIALALLFIRVHIVPESKNLVVERFGSALTSTGAPRVLLPGLRFTIRFVDKIRKEQSIQEQTLDTRAQEVLAGGVLVNIDGILFWRVGHVVGHDAAGQPEVEVSKEDVYKATYGIKPGEPDPLVGLREFAISTLRDVSSRIATPDFDKLEDAQKNINQEIRREMNEGTKNWGIVVMRHEIQNFRPATAAMLEALENSVRAVRDAKAQATRSEGVMQETINIAKGNKEKEILAGEARRDVQITDAEGEGARLERLAKAAEKPGAPLAFQFQIAEEIAEAVAKLAASGNVILMNGSDMGGQLSGAAWAFLKQYRDPTSPPAPQPKARKPDRSRPRP